jgi:hypothetical protein
MLMTTMKKKTKNKATDESGNRARQKGVGGRDTVEGTFRR